MLVLADLPGAPVKAGFSSPCFHLLIVLKEGVYLTCFKLLLESKCVDSSSYMNLNARRCNCKNGPICGLWTITDELASSHHQPSSSVSVAHDGTEERLLFSFLWKTLSVDPGAGMASPPSFS